jgi:GT2 family glycosyltransferase
MNANLPHANGLRRVCVVIPNWNGAHLLRDVCLPALAHQTFRDFSVIVVDNGSSDGSTQYIATAWPSVELVRLERNHGFAGAVNRGIEASRSEFVALVNSDIELEPSWLKHAVAALDQLPSAGCVTGKILQFKDRALIASAGDTITWDAICDGRGRGQPDMGQFDADEPVFSGTGAASLYRRCAFDVVGVFDEDFFAYLEDIDWGFRAQLAGFSCWYTPKARSYHMGRATTNRLSGLLVFLLIRNTLWLAIKNFPAPILLRNFPRILLVPGLRSYRNMREGIIWPVAHAWLSAAAGLPKMLRKRRSIQSRRHVTMAELQCVIAHGDLASPRLSRLRDMLLLKRGKVPST